MRKKLLSLAVLALLCVTGVRAQVDFSQMTWVVRAGFSMMHVGGDGISGTDAKAGYNATVEFNNPLGAIGEQGAYWGMSLGLGSRGFKAGKLKAMANNIQLSPFTFGWKIGVLDNFRIDPRVGVYASVDYATKMKAGGGSISWGDFADGLGVDRNAFDVGMNLGIGFWYDRFNLDLAYQQGFVNGFTDINSNKFGSFMLRLGMAF